MQIKYFQVDAFTNKLFSGNPAGVCPLQKWLPDEMMQKIAFENNLSETAFIVPQGSDYFIRWFTPSHEVGLCGHATLATAYIVFKYLQPLAQTVNFHSASGPLYVKKEEDFFKMDFPATPSTPIEITQLLIDAIGMTPKEVHESIDYLVILENEKQLQELKPNFQKMLQLDLRGVIVSAPGVNCDFVSRFFAPKLAVSEDPVTGSAHCTLVPYWTKHLNKTKFVAHQISPRGGEILCELQGNRVILGGKAVSYLEGTITIPDENNVYSVL